MAMVKFVADSRDFFSFSTVSRPALEPTRPPAKWVGIIQHGHDSDDSPPSSANVKNDRASMSFHGIVLN
jgi:hypothetical protein